MRGHNNKVQEISLRTNTSNHDSIGNKLQCGGIPHGDIHPTGMQNMEDGTMSSCSTVISLDQHKILVKAQTITIMITHVVHQASDIQQRHKITFLIEIDPNGVAVLHHRKEMNKLTILVLILDGA